MKAFQCPRGQAKEIRGDSLSLSSQPVVVGKVLSPALRTRQAPSMIKRGRRRGHYLTCRRSKITVSISVSAPFTGSLSLRCFFGHLPVTGCDHTSFLRGLFELRPKVSAVPLHVRRVHGVFAIGRI